MINKKRGETNEQYIKRLLDEITQLQLALNKLAIRLEDTMNDNACVPISIHVELLGKYATVVNDMKRYGLWIG